MIGGRRPLQGRKPGDRRVRVERPHAALFRWTGPGQMVAKEAASVPMTAGGRMFARLKAMLLGRPLASEEEIGERLSKKKAFSKLSSDVTKQERLARITMVLAPDFVARHRWDRLRYNQSATRLKSTRARGHHGRPLPSRPLTGSPAQQIGVG